MDGQRIGRLIRVFRVRLELRQEDAAQRARVSRDLWSDIENGRVGTVRVGSLERAAAVVGLRLKVEVIPTRGDLAATADAAHAALLEQMVALLAGSGWEVAFEEPVQWGGIDILAFHADTGLLLVVEIKSRLVDLQETFRAMARYVEMAPGLARRRGWRVRRTSIVLVVGESRTQRRVIARHRSTFDAALPQRTAEIRRWIRTPVGELRGLMFLSYARRRDVMQHVATRVRPRGSGRKPRATACSVGETDGPRSEGL